MKIDYSLSRRATKDTSIAESKIWTGKKPRNVPEKNPSDSIGSGEALRGSRHQVSQLRTRVRAYEGHLSMERTRDGRGRRNSVRRSKWTFSEARLGESSEGITPWRDTLRFR